MCTSVWLLLFCVVFCFKYKPADECETFFVVVFFRVHIIIDVVCSSVFSVCVFALPFERNTLSMYRSVIDHCESAWFRFNKPNQTRSALGRRFLWRFDRCVICFRNVYLGNNGAADSSTMPPIDLRCCRAATAATAAALEESPELPVGSEPLRTCAHQPVWWKLLKWFRVQ